ncbi:MAG: SRPBCC family protein [Gemmatimonadales bacterium]
MAPPPKRPLTLRVRRTFPVSPERLFRAWTEPAELKRWAGPGQTTVGTVLVYTWFWETNVNMGETLVTVEFRDLGGRTEVVLTHELFPTEEDRENHEAGWAACGDGPPCPAPDTARSTRSR